MLITQRYLINFLQKVDENEQRIQTIEQKIGEQYNTQFNSLEQKIQTLEQRIDEQLEAIQWNQRSQASLRYDIDQFKKIQEPLELFVKRITISNGSDLLQIHEVPRAFHYCSHEALKTMKNIPPIECNHGLLFENSFYADYLRIHNSTVHGDGKTFHGYRSLNVFKLFENYWAEVY